MLQWVFLSIFWCLNLVLADGSDSFSEDPILKYRPNFANSLPVQILVTGVVLALVIVLLIHLIFTAQYHWPLAPVNYALQLSGVVTLLISLIATLHVILDTTMVESKSWPYMFSYIAVDVPPLSENSSGWSVAERVTWLVMNASTSGLVQITHIHFLTLLFPSHLEARLIYFLLGPLALVAAVMQILPINGKPEVTEVASAIGNICNAALSLIFTTFLVIWGLLINRGQAWRTDGGTAAFGAGALSLALASTCLNLLYLPRAWEYDWLFGLTWAIVLWQSFLGWWWWVGAGSGGGLETGDEVEERLKKDEMKQMGKREKGRVEKEMKETRRREKKETKRIKQVLEGISGTLHQRRTEHPQAGILPEPDPTAEDVREGEHTQDHPQDGRTNDQPESDTSSSSMRSSVNSTRFWPSFAWRWYHTLRRAHMAAAREQAVERAARYRGRQREGNTITDGWGLGNFIPADSWSGGRASASAGSIRDDNSQDHERAPEIPEPHETFMWGFLGKWRLRDATVY